MLILGDARQGCGACITHFRNLLSAFLPHMLHLAPRAAHVSRCYAPGGPECRLDASSRALCTRIMSSRYLQVLCRPPFCLPRLPTSQWISIWRHFVSKIWTRVSPGPSLVDHGPQMSSRHVAACLMRLPVLLSSSPRVRFSERAGAYTLCMCGVWRGSDCCSENT